MLASLPLQNPRDFGLALLILTLLNLPPEHAPKEALRYLAAELNVDPSLVQAWVRGEVRGRKALTPVNFRKLLLFFLRQPQGLRTSAAVRAFAQAAGEDYLIELTRPSLQEHLAGLENQAAPRTAALSFSPTPSAGYTLPRRALLDELQAQARRSQMQRSPLVVCGPPGVGKSILLEHLAQDPVFCRGWEGVLRADLAAGRTSVWGRAWLTQVGPPLPFFRSRTKGLGLRCSVADWLGSGISSCLITSRRLRRPAL